MVGPIEGNPFTAKEHLPAAPTPIPAWLAEPKPVPGRFSETPVAYAPAVKRDGPTPQGQKNSPGELVRASTLQSAPMSPHQLAQIAGKLLEEAEGDLAVARTRLAGARETFAPMKENPGRYSPDEFADAKAKVENREWQMRQADARARKAGDVYRAALGKDPESMIFDYRDMPPAL